MSFIFEHFRDAAVEARKRLPIVERSHLSKADEAKCRINGGSLIGWLNRHGPHFLQQRAFWSPHEDEPKLIFTSDMTGLVAAQEILGPSPDGIVYLLDEEAEEGFSTFPDLIFDSCVHFWAKFRRRLPNHFARDASDQYPIPPRARYWIHEEGTVWGPLAGQGGAHLWMWDGNEAVLLEEAFERWVS